MRRILTILLLLCSLGTMALVPPRDLSRWDEWQAMREARRVNRAPAAQQAVGQRVIIPRILLITVSFSDFPFTTPQADVDSMFNGLNWNKDGATGSLRQYYCDQSNGAYNPRFDVVGPVTLSKGYADYGAGNDSRANISNMVCEACSLVDDSVDFSLYDSNNDGFVDLVYIYYAGFGANDKASTYAKSLIPTWNDLVWPAYWSVSTTASPRYFDGKYISACEYSNELDAYYTTATKTVPAGIGTACHEFGHALGLPDLYTTDDNAIHKVLGDWDVMCYGLYNNDTHTPPSLSAYERFYMGWLTPTLITEPDTLTLEYIGASNQAYLISENDTHNMDGLRPDTAVFYMLENRLRTGWDIGIPGNGLLLTRISFSLAKWMGNTVNNDANAMGVDLIEADGLAPVYNSKNTNNGYFGKPGDLFPTGATSYHGIPDHDITEITMSDGVIRFAYRGGLPPDTDTVHTPDVLPVVEMKRAYKTVRNGQLLIHSGGHTYSIYGIKQDN
ncbi:MAG: M6 family metalloprotease domain-containing protein [Paludibacteraceae bacterium]|nr:M6 family metalloprotease domain-containing protein [Paludibacteraceae bacterium]